MEALSRATEIAKFFKEIMCVCVCVFICRLKTHIHTCTQGNTGATVANGHRHGKGPAEKTQRPFIRGIEGTIVENLSWKRKYKLLWK